MADLADQSEVALKVIGWRVIKWEGDEPLHDPARPEDHPACIEVIEGGDDVETRVVYKRTK